MSGQHILKGLNKFGEAFPQHTDGLIENLSKLFLIDPCQLNRTVDSLYLFDFYFIEHVNEIDEGFIQNTILCLIAYVGEVYIHTEGGRWKMILYEDTWEPMIEDKKGNLHQRFFVLIYKTLLEDEYPSIQSCYHFTTNNLLNL